MCGLVGYFGNKVISHFGEMVQSIYHRGPDGSGIWHENHIWMGHRRLALIDLSPTGAQPMMSHDQRFVICYNGEVYNLSDLKQKLPAINWRGHSDTEVILESIAHRGLHETLKDLNGMFAFSLYDRNEKTIHIVRDPVGIKPLYWASTPHGLTWASELKALRNITDTSSICPEGSAYYWKYGYIPAPYTIYKGINKLKPGHILSYQINGSASVEPYWSIHDQPYNPGSLEEVEETLTASIKRTMMADVPVGSLLSGGVDSSLTTAIMQSLSDQPIKTFTIGFESAEHDEAPFAKKIAEHLGTEHHEHYVTAHEAQSVIPKIPSMYDEPFADSSAIPTFLVFQLAKRHVKTVLSGDGGDELWAGYKRYQLLEHMWKFKKWGGKTLGYGIRAIPEGMWNKIFKLLPKKFSGQNPGRRLHTLARYMHMPDVQSLYEALLTLWPTHAKLPNARSELSRIDQMRHIDIQSYLPEDILTKVDRASMAVSVEARVPLLDRSLLERNWPSQFGKVELRKILEKYVPSHLFERPKMGFGIPLDDWLRTDLKDWANDLLEPAKLAHTPFGEEIHNLWLAHQSGKVNASALLWAALMFQSWSSEQKSLNS